MPKMKDIQNVVQKLSRGQKSAAGAGAGIRTSTKNIKSPLVYRGDLINESKFESCMGWPYLTPFSYFPLLSHPGSGVMLLMYL